MRITLAPGLETTGAFGSGAFSGAAATFLTAGLGGGSGLEGTAAAGLAGARFPPSFSSTVSSSVEKLEATSTPMAFKFSTRRLDEMPSFLASS